ncbi:bifunctional DNA-binding transcriptional regulator/O6-methylguanine-DNA methyltransferase Ada [Granulicella arctica]|uniref:AraC family transcriptional regulator of adaptative response/methylated-DNA-[protein]-cysteine methyltransferase n=1 Tax=Granulicella arctica TaxID=940613 RepID=A0A7Y9PHF5_9BACT|nr:bifunctional DNA-binding transcriptional regulator/O6-methylguanine-DNA methyltransferase Ada [Granulicella arctica]NYF79251.1 AraC family transcriptional regulator of adaptative response/methylated-DNA-[protein]-cysteine methyltransferase [Granulicella arctica]
MTTLTMTKPLSASSIPSLFPGKQWQQVLERDTAADGQFFYAVKSTKVYCKPSCPSRRPTRKNVTFFPTTEAAQAAGYRACLRCEPDRTTAKPDPQAGAIAAVTEYLKDHATERTKLAEVAKATGVGRLTILRGFKRVLGVSPGQYAKAQRIDSFKKGLREPGIGKTEKRVTDAIYEAGYGSSSRLYEKSNATLGMKPRVMREGGAGLLIRYCMAASPLGRMLVATTDVGICSITFGKDDAELVKGLRESFNKAQLVPAKGNTGWLADAVAFVVSQMSEHPLAATFPLDVRATAFQQRVWRALQEIPRGETRSYSELAATLGKPSAVRAVAGACAANSVAIAVPCHRVVGKDGSLTGYRWGTERKKKLLEAEKARISA